jgi:hypothetical protein
LSLTSFSRTSGSREGLNVNETYAHPRATNSYLFQGDRREFPNSRRISSLKPPADAGRSDMQRQSLGWTFSSLQGNGQEDLLFTCERIEDSTAMTDWLCYTKPLDRGDQLIVVRQRQTGMLVSRFSTCGFQTAPRRDP